MTKDKKTDDYIISPHDKAFRVFFSNLDVAKSFLIEHVPEHLRKHLDLRTLKIYKDSFIEEKLGDFKSDLLYRVKYKNTHLFFYLLFEHKSFVDKWTPFQVLKYLVRIWELHLEQEKNPDKLPAIMPMVIYHGESGWNIGTRFTSLFDSPADFKEYIPDFGFRLYDLSHIPDEEIRGYVLLKVIMMTFKYIFQPGELENRLEDIFSFFNDIEERSTGLEYLRALIRYLYFGSKFLKYGVLEEKVKAAISYGGDVMQTIGQELLEKGEKRGIAKGEKRGIAKGEKKGIAKGEKRGIEKTAKEMLKNGLPIDIIHKCTGLSIEKINKLKTAASTH